MKVFWITLFFRSLAILIGSLMGFFGWKIFQITKGATKGWMYLSFMGISLFFWSVSSVIFKIFDAFYLRIIFGSIFLLSMAFFAPFSYSYLVRDFGIKKRFNPFILVSILAIFFFITLFLHPFSLVQLLTISHITLGLSLILTSIPTFILMRSTKKSSWILAFIFTIIVGLTLVLGQHYNNCCSEGGELSSELVCGGYDLDYIGVFSGYCNNFLVGIGAYYQIFLLIGIIIGVSSFYLIWKNLK